MYQYFFHLRDGQDVLLDPEGVELSSLDEVKASALFSARSILSSEVRDGKLPLYLRLEIEDEKGKVVYSLPFEDAVAIQVLPPGTS